VSAELSLAEQLATASSEQINAFFKRAPFVGYFEVGGADVFVVSVRFTSDEPSACFVVFSVVSEVVLLPVSVVVLVWVRVVVVDFGGVLLPQAVASTAEIAIRRKRWDMREATCK
jgi:hypothetical protein